MVEAQTFVPLLILAGPGPGNILWPDERGWPHWLEGTSPETGSSPLFPARPKALTAAIGADNALHLVLWEEQGGWYRGSGSGWQSLPAELGQLHRPRLFAAADGLHLLGEGPARQLQHWRQLAGNWRLERTWSPARWEAVGNAKLGLVLVLGGDRPGQHWRWETDMWQAVGLNDLPAGEPVALLAAGPNLDLAWLAKGRLFLAVSQAGDWGSFTPLASDLRPTDEVHLWQNGQRLAVQWARPSGGVFVRYSENLGVNWSAALHRSDAWQRPLQVIYGPLYPGPYAQAVHWPPGDPPPLRPADLALGVWPLPTREIHAASKRPPATPAGPPSYFVALDERLRRLEDRVQQPPESKPTVATAPPTATPWWRRLWPTNRTND